jgi:hypothetical protein
MRMRDVLVAAAVLASGPASAGTLVGKVELPSNLPVRPKPAEPGFVERYENPVTPVRPLDVTQRMVIVVEGDEKPAAPPRVQWNLVGESFAHPVIAAAAGAEVTIINQSKTARTLVAKEDPKLIEPGPINPSGPKTLHPNEAGKVYTIVDKDAPYLVGRLVVVNTQYIAYPDESGHFEIENIPPGSYKLKIWFDTGWINRPAEDVNISVKGKTDINPKLGADAFAGSAPKK